MLPQWAITQTKAGLDFTETSHIALSQRGRWKRGGNKGAVICYSVLATFQREVEGAVSTRTPTYASHISKKNRAKYFVKLFFCPS